MPGFDKTGPLGQGSMTGRKRGRCRDTQTAQSEKTSEQTAENKEVVYGLGRGGRRRGGAGLGKRFGNGSGFGGGRRRGRRSSNM